jgi:hypothetical protein
MGQNGKIADQYWSSDRMDRLRKLKLLSPIRQFICQSLENDADSMHPHILGLFGFLGGW